MAAISARSRAVRSSAARSPSGPTSQATATSNGGPASVSRLTNHLTTTNRKDDDMAQIGTRSEEHTSELQSLMRISYAVFCLKKKNRTYYYRATTHTVNRR